MALLASVFSLEDTLMLLDLPRSVLSIAFDRWARFELPDVSCTLQTHRDDLERLDGKAEAVLSGGDR